MSPVAMPRTPLPGFWRAIMRVIARASAGGRFGEERGGIRMLQQQHVMLRSGAGQAQGATSLALPKRPSGRGRG